MYIINNNNNSANNNGDRYKSNSNNGHSNSSHSNSSVYMELIRPEYGCDDYIVAAVVESVLLTTTIATASMVRNYEFK